MAFRSHLVADHQARPRAGADAGHRRAAGARGRAHRAAGPDAADGEPQGHLAHRRGAGRAARATAALQASLPPQGAPVALLQRHPVRRFPRSAGDHRRSASTRWRRAACTGHLIQVLDPAEETLAYEGRMEFRSPEGSERWIADRVETLRGAYQQEARRASRQHRGGGAPHRLVVPRASHRPAGRRAAAHADHAPAGHGRRLPLEARDAQRAREARHDARPDRLPEPVAAGRPAGAAGDLVAAAHHPAAAAAHRVSADAHPGRHREPREDAGHRRPGG